MAIAPSRSPDSSIYSFPNKKLPLIPKPLPFCVLLSCKTAVKTLSVLLWWSLMFFASGLVPFWVPSLTNLFIIDNGCFRESKHGLIELLLLFMLADFPSQTSFFFEGREKDFLSCMSSDSLRGGSGRSYRRRNTLAAFFDVLHAS